MAKKKGNSRARADEECDFTNPAEVLRAFMTAMHDWEPRTFQAIQEKAGRPNLWKALAPFRKELDRIFARYCTPKDQPRARQASCCAAMAPTYDLAREVIREVVEETANRVAIHTERMGTAPSFRKTRHVYVLLRKNGRWLLDNSKMLLGKGKTLADYL